MPTRPSTADSGFRTGAPGISSYREDVQSTSDQEKPTHPSDSLTSNQGRSGHFIPVPFLLLLLRSPSFSHSSHSPPSQQIFQSDGAVLSNPVKSLAAQTKIPQIPSRARQSVASRAQRFVPAAATAVGSSHGGDSQVRHAQPAPRYVMVRRSVSAAAQLVLMPLWSFVPGILGIFLPYVQG